MRLLKNKPFGRKRKVFVPKIVHPTWSMVRTVSLGVVLLVLVGLFFGWRQLLPASVLSPQTEEEHLRVEVATLQQKVEKLEIDRASLRQQLADLERRSQVDREAVSKAKEELKRYQTERLDLQEEVAFLRGIVSSGEGIGVLRIQHFHLERGGSDNLYRYRFTISKVLRDSIVTTGQIRVTLDGKQGFEERSLPLKEVTANNDETLKMRFRHFQNIEGEFSLPSGFRPSGVTIEVDPDGKGFSPASKHFDWVITG